MLECRDISFSYDGKHNVLKDISLSFQPGLFYGIFGPNGSGKSTLLKLLTGELKSTCGTVSPVWGDPLIRAQYIALVEQQIPASLPFTVEEVALLGGYPWKKAGKVLPAVVDSVLEELGLAALRKRSFNALSGGERQRVMLARALVQNTPLLCLDEPGSSLDVGSQHTLCRILKKLAAEGKCVIMVSHDLFSAPAYLDRMILLDKGYLAMEGDPDDVKNAPSLRRIFNLP